MADEKDKKAEAQIFRKPIHHKATRKVSAIPKHLLQRAERPDGEKATKVEDELEDAELELGADISDGGLFDELFGDEDEDEDEEGYV